ncbi:MAG: efflux RND transporter periplasmic adaptor subunit [Candidatus Sphingomonas colombiensis]|nr:efflux RND transporter periplasmic adaptor subunit [Sphingomonas sp.]WEK41939.1 MAG: efflux RND transporter periplasmic adaptor subunit [Sphingomonas sp.]
MIEARRRRHIVLGALGLLALILVAWVLLRTPPAKATPPPPIPVTAAKAVSRDLPISIIGLGAAQAWNSITILSQVSGKLLRVNFTEGSDVRAGQVLAEVDPSPYLAALQQAEGTLRRDQAQLAGARLDLKRYQLLQSQDSIARQTAEDQAVTVAQDEGTVEIDQGAVAAARLNLRWCHITAPVAGRVGVRLVDPGNLVSASGSTASTPSTAAATSNTPASGSGGSGIVVLNEIQPIAVTFTVAEGDFNQIRMLSGDFRNALAVQALSQEDGELLDTGELRIADNRVDPATGTVQLKARFPNGGRHLWPGQFVNVKLATQTIRNAVVIPTTAVNRGPSGQYAFVIGKDGTAAMRPIATEGAEGTLTAVKSGVKPGEIVVVDGQMTLKAGSKVRIVRPAPGQTGA